MVVYVLVLLLGGGHNEPAVQRCGFTEEHFWNGAAELECLLLLLLDFRAEAHLRWAINHTKHGGDRPTILLSFYLLAKSRWRRINWCFG